MSDSGPDLGLLLIVLPLCAMVLAAFILAKMGARVGFGLLWRAFCFATVLPPIGTFVTGLLSPENAMGFLVVSLLVSPVCLAILGLRIAYGDWPSNPGNVNTIANGQSHAER